MHAMIDADAEAARKRDSETERKQSGHDPFGARLGHDALEREHDREAALERHQGHEKARVRDVDDVEERVKLAHEVRRDAAYVQFMVAVDRYEKKAAGQVRNGQVHDEERNRLLVAQLLLVHDEHEHIADDAHQRNERVLNDYDCIK